MGLVKIFSREWRRWIFPGEVKDYSKGGAKNDEISIFPLATRKTTFCAKYLIRKCHISKFRGTAPTPRISERPITSGHT